MRCIDAALVVVIVITAVEANDARGGVIRLDNSSGALGERLDGIAVTDLGTPSAGPYLVPGFPSLSVLVADLGGAGVSFSANSTLAGMGVNSVGRDEPARFDSLFDEEISLSFSNRVVVHQLDFRHFGQGEIFEFAGAFIQNEDLSDGRTDVFDFVTPWTIEAATPFTMRATVGSIGIEAITLELADQEPVLPNAAVPEPSTLVMFATLGLSCLGLRRRGEPARTRPTKRGIRNRNPKIEIQRFSAALRKCGCHRIDDPSGRRLPIVF
ncbi:MAG: PEP-CTERM sorting domain-containing protein [Rubripirellula sp.]|jgi:hypothetical protein|nr:PEP-CTERM sorting domain-containing protein [Planctomycetaceae bacterium]MDF1841200.1 PEP-CTERM sorting domain-containing protein [Rubripirellula sp.]